MNGSTQERDLVNALDSLGLKVMRSPASGAATKREQPDVLAGGVDDQGAGVAAIELKSGSNPRNLTTDEAAELEAFAAGYDAAALVAVRYSGDRTFYLARLDDLERTDSGRVSLSSLADRLPWVLAIAYDDDGVKRLYDAADADVEPDRLPDWFRRLRDGSRRHASALVGGDD